MHNLKNVRTFLVVNPIKFGVIIRALVAHIYTRIPRNHAAQLLGCCAARFLKCHIFDFTLLIFGVWCGGCDASLG